MFPLSTGRDYLHLKCTQTNPTKNDQKFCTQLRRNNTFIMQVRHAF